MWGISVPVTTAADTLAYAEPSTGHWNLGTPGGASNRYQTATVTKAPVWAINRCPFCRQWHWVMPRPGAAWWPWQRHRLVPWPGPDAQYLAQGLWHQSVPLAHPYEYPSPFPLQAAVNYHGRFIGLHGCTTQLLLVLSRQIKSSELPVINSILISSTCSGVMHDILLGILLIGICYLNIGVLILKLCMITQIVTPFAGWLPCCSRMNKTSSMKNTRTKK